MSLIKLKELIQKFGPYALLGVIIFFIVFYSIKIGLVIYRSNKGEDLVINPVFGVVTKPQIEGTTTSAGLKFQIDTIEGKPVTATRSAKVYFLPPSSTKFSYRDKITASANQLGINNIDSYNLQSNIASFKEGPRSFTVDITNFNFNFSYDYTSDVDLFTRSIIPTAEDAKKEAIEILNSIERYPNEFNLESPKINYFFFSTEKKTTVPVARNIDANIAEVNFFRGGLDGISTISKKYPNSINHATLATADNNYVPVNLQVKFFERSTDQVGTYPVITGDEAYDALKNGEGIVLLNTDPDIKNKLIKKMHIAYYEPDEYVEYLLPVYVFENDTFAAIVWAINKEYLSE
ncbi:MAG: hypothetical protein WEC80_00290 [Patescibacteria group bacterium]